MKNQSGIDSNYQGESLRIGKRYQFYDLFLFVIELYMNPPQTERRLLKTLELVFENTNFMTKCLSLPLSFSIDLSEASKFSPEVSYLLLGGNEICVHPNKADIIVI